MVHFLRDPTTCYFHCALGFSTLLLAYMLDSLVRVSRRGKENHFPSITSTCVTPLGSPQDQTARLTTPRRSYPPSRRLSRDRNPCWPLPGHSAPAASGRGNMTGHWHWFPSLPFQQFQVLFNSLFKVLCIFPSRYLCTIGLPPVFSFRRNLPPNLSINPKILDSLRAHAKARRSQARTGVSPSQLPYSKGLGPEPRPMTPL